MFDINAFYPSVKKKTFRKALELGKTHLDISQKDIEVMFHSQKNL